MSYHFNPASGRRARPVRVNYSHKRTATRQPKKDFIHPSRFIKSAQPQTDVAYVAAHRFADFAIDPLLQRNIKTKGFETPSPIQDQTIPVALNGKDVVGIANTGTGKTAAFAIPLLHLLMTRRDAHVLILAPTRELAQQIEQECRSLAKGSNLPSALLIGGVSIRPQLRDLRANPRLIIGTPGRTKDHIQQGSLKIARFNAVVLDEVDRMLDMGFINDIRSILSQTADKKQSFFFSATLDAKVKSLIDSFASDPVHIVVKTSETSDHVEQNVVTYGSKDEKISKLHDLLIHESARKVLVFDDTKRSVDKLNQELQNRGFQVDVIHGGRSQAQRQRALKRFKDSYVNILVATDVAARGIDVADITHVVNYSQPQSYSDYVHRIGRAGRAGRTGHALTFVEE